MTPMFMPAQLEYGAPRVYLAAVGPKMTEVAAENVGKSILPALQARCRGQIDRLMCSLSFMSDEKTALRELQGEEASTCVRNRTICRTLPNRLNLG